MKKILITSLLVLLFSCTSEFNFDPVEKIPTIRDTIYGTVHDTINLNIATKDTIYETIITRDTIHEIVYDTILVTNYDTIQVTKYETIYKTVYDTIYKPTRVAIKFLNISDQYIRSGIDTVYLDGPEQVRWDKPEDPGACVNTIIFELAPIN
jgi:hypothetical protein